MDILKKWFPQIPRAQNKVENVPVHVAIIMDGNGRWANKRSLPRTAGHQAGMERIRDAVAVCLQYDVKYLTLYAFSTENWQRPAEEVGFLMNLFEKALKTEVEKLHQQNVKIRFIGLKQGLPPTLVELMENSEKLTAPHQALTLNIAINYGGRSEIISATKGLLRAVHKTELMIENITEQALAGHLFTADQPDPDLLIRPGGERRISNFLVWQLAYTELYFTDLYWPDFGKEEMIKAFQFYSQRERRFGRIKEVKG
jgi:undecaprenyl diphosphate synthase